MVQFKEIEYNQYFNVEHAVVPLCDQGTVLVVGNIGQGKSALFIEGPYYALFGASFEYGERPGSNVMRRWAKKMLVRLDFSVGAENYRIVRNQGHKVYQDLQLNRNGLFLFQKHGNSWRDVSRSQAKDTQAIINSLVGMSPRTFCQVALFAADSFKLPDASDRERKSIIDELLQIGSVDDALEATNVQIKELLTKIAVSESALELATTRLREHEESLRDAIEESAKFESGRAERINNLRARADSIKDDIRKHRDVMDSKEPTLVPVPTRLTDDISNVKERLKHLEKIRLEVEEDQPSDSEKRRAKSELEAVTASIKDSRCQTCKRKMDHLSDDELRDLMQSAEVLRETYLRISDEYDEDVRDWNDAMSRVKTAIADANRRLRTLEVDLDDAKEAHRSSLSAVERWRARRQDAANAIASLESALEALDLQVAEEPNPWPPQIDKLRKQKKASEATQEKAKLDLSELQQEIGDERILADLFGPKGCRIQMTQAAIPVLNDKCAEMAAAIGSSIVVEFRIRGSEESHSGTVEVVVDNPVGAGSYHGCSKGEQRLVDIIILFAFLSLSMAGHSGFGQAFFDEAFERIFPGTKNLILSMIRRIGEGRNSVFIVTHVTEGLDLSLVDQVWSVKGGILDMRASL